MDTFIKEIKYIAKVLQGEEWVEEQVTKMATFKELSRTDRSQHKLHFKLMTIFSSKQEEGEEEKVYLESDAVYDLTVKAVKVLAVPDQEFTEQDMAEFLNDSGAIFTFGMWLMENKLTPFFAKFNPA